MPSASDRRAWIPLILVIVGLGGIHPAHRCWTLVDHQLWESVLDSNECSNTGLRHHGDDPPDPSSTDLADPENYLTHCWTSSGMMADCFIIRDE